MCMKKVFVFLVSLMTSTLALFVVNYTIITPIIIGNKCEHDIGKNELTKLENLFFEISSNTGYHPEPTSFNFIFTAIMGFIIGSTIYRIISR